MRFIKEFLIIFTLLEVILAEEAKLSAIIVNTKLPTPLWGHSAIYDGYDGIFIFGGFNGIENTNRILHYDVPTAEVTLVGEMPDSGRLGLLALDAVGNIFYLGGGIDHGDVYKFNPKNRICKNVTKLPFDARYGSSINYNASNIFIFGGWQEYCKTIVSFDLNTYETNFLKNSSINICGSLAANDGDKIFIYKWGVMMVILNKTTLEEKISFVEWFNLQIYSSYARVGNSVYIMGAFNVNDTENNYKHGIIKFDLKSGLFSFIPVQGFILTGNSIFDNAPAAVFVKRLNRIYLFGGRSIDYETQNPVGHMDIWYIDLNPQKTGGNLLWIVVAVILFITLVIGPSAFVILKSTKKITIAKAVIQCRQIQKEKTNPVWRSSQSLELISTCPIGSGSFAEVYKAKHSIQPTFFAIKKIRFYKALQQMEWDIQKVLREVDNLSEILNPNVVRMWNCWIENENGDILRQNEMEKLPFKEWSSTQDFFIFLQMEFCDSTLRDWLTENETLEKRMGQDVNSIMLQIVNGLRGLHEKGIIHRDIKPNNIFYCENENLWKIGDLGLSAKLINASVDEHTVAGCQLYRSPEMESNEKTANYNLKSDVFSLGLTFLEMICIFPSDTSTMKIFEGIRKTPNELPNEIIAAFVKIPSPNLIELVSQMLARDPCERVGILDCSIDTYLAN